MAPWRFCIFLVFPLLATAQPPPLIPERLLPGEEEKPPYEVDVMLRSAVEATGLNDEAAQITKACAFNLSWPRDFEIAVHTMLHKSTPAMAHGLHLVAQSVLKLIDDQSCGNFTALDRFKEQATRLSVLATSKTVGDLDSGVRYEPMKALTVGGVDVHEEINDLIITWQMKKSPEDVGSSLMRFLKDFSAAEVSAADVAQDKIDELPEGEQAATESSTTAAPETAPETPTTPKPDPYQRLPMFWMSTLNEVLVKHGDHSYPVMQHCISKEVAETMADSIDQSFKFMIEKNRRSMQKGLKLLANSTVNLLDAVAVDCLDFKSSAARGKIRQGAARLLVLAAAKSLINHAQHVTYEPMKELKIAGIDVHIELNKFIGAWLHNEGNDAMATAITNFFGYFKEQEEDKVPEAPKEQPRTVLFTIFQDAIRAVQIQTPPVDLPSSCFPDEGADATFLSGFNGAIEHMLQKRKRFMQQGLKEMADTTYELLMSQPEDCISGEAAQILVKASRKLRNLTRRTVVDYGTHIKYEAMKSLEVGGVAIHAELNEFLAAWKLKSHVETGAQLGALMLKLSTIEGHDEL